MQVNGVIAGASDRTRLTVLFYFLKLSCCIQVLKETRININIIGRSGAIIYISLNGDIDIRLIPNTFLELWRLPGIKIKIVDEIFVFLVMLELKLHFSPDIQSVVIQV